MAQIDSDTQLLTNEVVGGGFCSRTGSDSSDNQICQSTKRERGGNDLPVLALDSLPQYESLPTPCLADSQRQLGTERANISEIQYSANPDIAPPNSIQENSVVVDAKLQQLIYKEAPTNLFGNLMMKWWIWQTNYDLDILPPALYISKGTMKNPDVLNQIINTFGIRVMM